MKTALVLESDQDTCEKTSNLVRWLGYVVAPVCSAAAALNIVKALNFSLIVTNIASNPSDRRSLTAELKRAAPDAMIVLVANDEKEYSAARFGKYRGLSAVIRRPVALDTLRRIVEFHADEFGTALTHGNPHGERRKKLC